MMDLSNIPADIDGQAQALLLRAQTALKTSDLLGAMRYFTGLAELLELSELHREQAEALVQVAALKGKLQLDEEVIEIYLRVWDLLDRVGDEVAKAMVLNNLGHCYVKRKSWAEALRCFSVALEVFRGEQADKGIADQLQNIGSVHRDRGVHAEALNHYFGALSVYERISDGLSCADQFVNIGYIYAMQGQTEEALNWFEKAVPVFETFEALVKAEFTRQNIARLRLAQGET